MEPLRPTVRDAILTRNPQAAPAEIDEYERLLANRFATDPALTKAPEKMGADAILEKRLNELFLKLFGDANTSKASV